MKTERILSSDDLALKLANSAGINRWKVYLDEWLESHICRWRADEALWKEREAELRALVGELADELSNADDILCDHDLCSAGMVKKIATLLDRAREVNEQEASLSDKVSELVTACNRLRISNETWNPFSPTFVKPWPEFYRALEAVERELMHRKK